jgi:hypothetical protein
MILARNDALNQCSGPHHFHRFWGRFVFWDYSVPGHAKILVAWVTIPLGITIYVVRAVCRRVGIATLSKQIIAISPQELKTVLMNEGALAKG